MREISSIHSSAVLPKVITTVGSGASRTPAAGNIMTAQLKTQNSRGLTPSSINESVGANA